MAASPQLTGEARHRITEKFANFRTAVQRGKCGVEGTAVLRARRYQVFGDRSAIETIDREEVDKAFFEREMAVLRTTRRQWSTNDFDPVCVLGQGAFGIVHLVKQKGHDKFFALKEMDKSRYQRKNNRERAYAERDILAEARTRWFVELYATFQDSDHVFMLMEFVPGGDLITYLQKKNRFSPKETAFYMAELLEALDCVHKHGYVHRDVKPDNVILTQYGHLKLLDFGLCKHEAEVGEAGEDTSRRARLRSRAGTPQYMAPESFQGETSPAADIWALGIMTFECLYGVVPFHAGNKQSREAITSISVKVMNHATEFPKRLQKAKAFGFIPPNAEQFLRHIICDQSDRLASEALRHELFFSDIDFARLHLMQPPIQPKVNGPADVSNFDDPSRCQELPRQRKGVRKDPTLDWAHYEFDREVHDLERPEALEELFVVPSAGPPTR